MQVSTKEKQPLTGVGFTITYLEQGLVLAIEKTNTSTFDCSPTLEAFSPKNECATFTKPLLANFEETSATEPTATPDFDKGSLEA